MKKRTQNNLGFENLEGRRLMTGDVFSKASYWSEPAAEVSDFRAPVDDAFHGADPPQNRSGGTLELYQPFIIRK